MGNRLLIGVRKVPATRQLKADHPLTAKATKTKIYPKRQVNQRIVWTREEIREGIWCYMYCRKYLTRQLQEGV